MRRILVLAVAGFILTSCGGGDKPQPVLMTPNSRLIYHDTAGHGIFTFCDRGARVYQTNTGAFWVVPNGCPNGEP